MAKLRKKIKIGNGCMTAIRYGKLKAMVDKYNNGTLEFKPTCPMSIYDIQLRAMRDYLTILEARAAIEGVELDG